MHTHSIARLALVSTFAMMAALFGTSAAFADGLTAGVTTDASYNLVCTFAGASTATCSATGHRHVLCAQGAQGNYVLAGPTLVQQWIVGAVGAAGPSPVVVRPITVPAGLCPKGTTPFTDAILYAYPVVNDGVGDSVAFNYWLTGLSTAPPPLVPPAVGH